MVEKNKPIKQIRSGNVSASIFKNTGTSKDNKPFEYLSVQLQRSWTADNGKTWSNESLNFRKNDIAKLQIVLNEVARELYLGQKDTEEA